VYVVAILEATAGAASDAETLARSLGGEITALELRMARSAIHPSVLLRTPSREGAEQTAMTLTAAGLTAVAVDLAEVTPVDRMVHMRRFALDALDRHGGKALRADTQGPTLAYDELTAIVRVAADTSIWRTTREKEIVPTRGGGRTVEVEHTRTDHAVEQALFLFVRDEGVPWVLRASEARYLSLGGAMRPTAIENFLVTIALLRERAPHAIYDERFVARPLARQAETHVRGHESASPELADPGLEVRLHVLARVLGHVVRRGPYR
jgi:hypothetical protein